MAQLKKIIEQAGAIITLAERLKANENRKDAIELHRLTAELSTMALNVALNTPFD